MNITILAHGSRGDIQPYLALGLGLARAGDQVTLAAPGMFREMVQTHAAAAGQPIQFHPLPGDPLHLMRAAASPSRLVNLLPGSVRMALTVLDYVAPVVSQLIRECRAACQDADLVITTLLTSIIGHQIARERGVPDLAALLFPVFTPTTAFPNPLFGPWPGWMGRFGQRPASFGPRYNYLTHREFNRVFYHANRMAIQRLRRSDPGLILPLEEWPFGRLEALPPWTYPARPTPLLYGISRHTLGCPGDWAGSGEGTNLVNNICPHLIGYWFLDSATNWQPPEVLLHFLESGPPPVLVGFGSLIPRDARRLVRLAVQALEQSGQRGLLLSGWAGLNAADLPATVYPLSEAPFDWLFPHLAAAVHHGGMGTSAAALRAGIPSVVVPFTFDQPFWSRRIYDLGAGPRPIPPSQLTARRLAAAIRTAIEDKTIRQRAVEIGQLVRSEDGVGTAVRFIHQYHETA